jgi:hypothetical protein
MKMKATAGLLALVAAFASTAPARSEEQLPIDELYPCEVVLHELIAELRGLRAGAKRTLAGLHNEVEKERAATYTAAVQAWDEAIRVTTKKFDRCP